MELLMNKQYRVDYIEKAVTELMGEGCEYSFCTSEGNDVVGESFMTARNPNSQSGKIMSFLLTGMYANSRRVYKLIYSDFHKPTD